MGSLFHKMAFLVPIGLLSFKSHAQKVFSVPYPSQADLKVFAVKHESQADLCVFREKNASASRGNYGHWHFTAYPAQADTRVYLSNS